MIALRVASLAALLCALFVTAAGAQTPAPTSIWDNIQYPRVPIPGTATEELVFTLTSGARTNPLQGEPFDLRFDIQWATTQGVPFPQAIAEPTAIVVRLHTADGNVLTPRRPWPGFVGIGGGVHIRGGIGMSWSMHHIFPWSRNALDEAWIEVRVPGQTWWLELPYGFARNPDDPEVPDRNRGEPRFPPTMLPLSVSDILVPWLAAEYLVGRTHDGAVLSVKLSNFLDASASVTLSRDQTEQGGSQRPRFNLDTPRIAVTVQAGGDTLTGREIARRLSYDLYTRTADFSLGGYDVSDRAFGTVTITIDGRGYGVRVPSSLINSAHGRTDEDHKQWMWVPW